MTTLSDRGAPDLSWLRAQLTEQLEHADPTGVPGLGPAQVSAVPSLSDALALYRAATDLVEPRVRLAERNLPGDPDEMSQARDVLEATRAVLLAALQRAEADAPSPAADRGDDDTSAAPEVVGGNGTLAGAQRRRFGTRRG
ncbi:MAG: hypothetical protein ACR2LF_08835 [Jatrophihabitantaceae bacterium]